MSSSSNSMFLIDIPTCKLDSYVSILDDVAAAFRYNDVERKSWNLNYQVESWESKIPVYAFTPLSDGLPSNNPFDDTTDLVGDDEDNADDGESEDDEDPDDKKFMSRDVYNQNGQRSYLSEEKKVVKKGSAILQTTMSNL